MISFAESLPYLKDLAIFFVLVGTICILVTYEIAASILGVILSLMGIDPPDLSGKEYKIKKYSRIFGHIMILLGILVLAFLCYSTCYTCENLKPTISRFVADKSSPQEIEEIITWTVEASDTENDPISYKFFLNGRAVSDWQSISHWIWKTVDSNKSDNKIEVWIRDGKHADESGYDNMSSANFKIEVPLNQEPTISRFAADKSSLQKIGEIITWTAEASDAENDPISYKFFLNGRAVSDWQSINYWVLEIDDSNIVDNEIKVWIRDGKHANESGYDNMSSANFKIEVPLNQEPTISRFVPDKSSPREVGETITWTAEASDPEKDPILYMFFLNSEPVTDWQSVSHWIWEIDDSKIVDNEIKVWIKDGNHAVKDDYDDSKTASFSIIQLHENSLKNEIKKDEVVTTAQDEEPPKPPKIVAKPDVPKTGEIVELKLEPIPSGNITKYQWTTSLETPTSIGDYKESIHYAFKRDGLHEIMVEVKYKNGNTDRYNRSLNVIRQ